MKELNLSWVTPALALGGSFTKGSVVRLAREHHIRRVVDVRMEAVDDEATLRAQGIMLLHLPTLDCCAIALPKLHAGVEWVNQQLDGGHRVYIHCEHGVGRSALLTCCVLVSRGHAPLEALERAKGARPMVSPSPEQLGAFIAWTGEWRELNPVPWSPPSLEELMRIAYRHLASRASDLRR